MAPLINEVRNLVLLSSGGQKDVYKGDHSVLGQVVVKKIRPNVGGIELERIRREIIAVEKLQSEFVPKIFEHNANLTSAPFFYIVEQYIPAPTLREKLKAGARFSTGQLMLFLETLLGVACSAEAHRIIHRDLKPENILLDATPKFWILDFGISRHLDLPSITASNAPFGVFTVGYAASEQFRNLKREIDIRADLFSIGVIATEMIQGQNPYVINATDVLTVLRRIELGPVPLSSIQGDTQHQLATFIRILGDNRKSRRPRSALEAKAIFDSIKTTVRL